MEKFRVTRLRGSPPTNSVLTDIRSKCKTMPELEHLCLGVTDRLEILHDNVAELAENNPFRVKYVDAVVRLVKISRRKPLLLRLARFNTIALMIRELHQELDADAGCDATKWSETWEITWTEQFSTLENLIVRATDRQLVKEMKSEKMVEEVLMELNKELSKDIPENQLMLMQATLDRVMKFTQLKGVHFADWFICADDLEFDGGQSEVGTFGEVRRATWFHDGERTNVVVKELFPQTFTDADQEFYAQLERWSKLPDTKQILKLYGGSHVNKPHFFVSEYAPYGNLGEFQKGERNESLLWPLFLQVAEGLEFLHTQGIVHGALKHSNILIGENRTAKLADFGFKSARLHAIDVESHAMGASSSAVRWKPKEALEYSGLTGPQFESEIYSLGMCMIEALTSRQPFGVADDAEVVDMIMRGETHPRPDGVSDVAWSFVESLCDPEYMKRPTLGTVIEKLHELINEKDIESTTEVAETSTETNVGGTTEVTEWTTTETIEEVLSSTSEVSWMFGVWESETNPEVVTTTEANFVTELVERVEMVEDKKPELKEYTKPKRKGFWDFFSCATTEAVELIEFKQDTVEVVHVTEDYKPTETTEVTEGTEELIEETTEVTRRSIPFSWAELACATAFLPGPGRLENTRKTISCLSCTVSSYTNERWCRHCGYQVNKRDEKIMRHSLSNYLKKRPTIERWRILYEIALSLQDLHDQGILHANLKPASLVIGNDGEAHLTDLESCKKIADSPKCGEEDPRWQAPECLTGENLSFASNIYSFGLFDFHCRWSASVGSNSV